MTTTESYGCDKHGEDAYQGCAMCDLETLRERLHEAELVAASWKREAELNEQAANESSGYAKRLAEAEQQWDDWSARAEMAETAQVRAERERNDALARLADAHAAKTKAEESELACAAELDEVRARLAECERDAARYRWLRAEHDRVDPLARCGWKYRQDRNGHQWVDLPNGGQLDHMIDAAMGDGT